MANKIQVKRSAVAGKVPTTADIDLGEIAINTNDGKMYIKKDNGTASIVQVGYATGDVVGPASATDNALARFDGTTGKLVQNSLGILDDAGNLDVTSAKADYVDLDTAAAAPAYAQGRTFWDSGNGTPSVMLSADVTLQQGQEMLALVYNGTGATITNGTVVAVSGAQGQRPSVSLADADSEALSAPTLGIATQDIANGAEGFVTTFGFVRGINTSAFTAGAPIYLSQTAGQFTATRPSAPAHTVALGWVIKVNASSGEVFVNINNGWELDELHNVLITGAASGNTLIYDATTGVWKNAGLTPGTGISVTNGAGSITIANTGVTSITGTASQITASASTGGVTLSLPATINVNTSGNAANVTGTVAVANGGTGATTAATARTNLGATTVGGNMFTLANPSAVTFPRFNADNTVSALDAATFRAAIGAGVGTVTSVTGTAPVASSGGATPAISLAAAYGDTLNPYASKTANYVLAAPNGAAGVPTFRAIVAADIPTLNQNTTGTAANVTGTVAVANGGTGKTTAPAAMANLMGYTTTATAAGTTTLTNTSSFYQVFTGTTTQTITLPVTSTLQTGWTFHICNNSTGNLTVNSSGANLVITVIPGTTVMVTCIGTALTTAADWEAGFTDFSTITGTGANVMATSPTLVTPNIGVATGTSFNSITALSSTTPVIAGTAAVGTSTTVARADHVHPAQTTITGNAGTATTLATGRTIAMTGDVTWTSPSFNGSANVTAAATLASSGVTAGTYMSPKITVDAKGRVTSAATAVFTSSDNFVQFTQTANGWDVTKYVFPVPSWYYVESNTLGNLANNIYYPSNFTSSPTGFSGNMVIGAYANGMGWANMLTGWNSSSSWNGSMQNNYYSGYVNWGFINPSPLTVWMTAPTNGIVFSYLQYPPAGGNMSSYDFFGSASSGFNNGYGSSFTVSGPPLSGSSRKAYVVLMIQGNAGVVSSPLSGSTVVYAYNSYSDKTYVFCEVTNDASVGSITSGTGWLFWSGSPNSYWGHAWADYT